LSIIFSDPLRLTCDPFGQLETRLRVLEGKELGRSAGSTKGKPKIEVYEKDRKKGAGALITPAKVGGITNSLLKVFSGSLTSCVILNQYLKKNTSCQGSCSLLDT
jgi:hypothetical protein